MTVAKLNLLLLAVLVACAAALAACGTPLPPPVEVPKVVNVQTPVPCVDPARRPQRPALRTEGDLMNMPRGLRTLAAWSDLKAYEAYTAELEAVVEGCSRIARP